MAQMTSLVRTPLAWIIGALLALPVTALAQDAMSQGTAPLDDQARVLMGNGDASGALRLMREHVTAHPDDSDARLDLVRYLTWNGDYSGAKRILAADPSAAQTPEGQQVLAALLAWGGRIDGALQANAPLLAADADAFIPNYTQAIALRQTARPRTALPYVNTVNRLKPDSKDAVGLERGTHRYTDSFIALDYQRGEDSDDLVRSLPTLRAEIAQGDALRYTVELGRWDYRSPLTSPFVSIDGNRSIDETRGLFGIRYAASLRTELSAAIGRSSIDNAFNGNDGLTVWRASVRHRANDDLRFDLGIDHDRVTASPRSVSLGLDRTSASGHLQWTPDLDWTGDVWIRHDDYSDDNTSLEWSAALRRAVVRKPGVLLDLGVAAQHIGFDFNPGNGYYAPDNYRRYAVTANGYFGLSDDIGLSWQASLGRQRDETFSGWRRASDVGGSMVFGIFSPWQFGVNAGYSERVQGTGAYEGFSWGMTLTRRF